MDVEQKSKLASREAVALNLARLVDVAVDDRVLVLGSLPPRGRDLELVVRPVEHRAVAEQLTEEGLARRGLEWARFFDSTAYAVELIPAERLSLSAGELAALFDEARTLNELGLGNVVRPAPHHVVLLQARRLVRDGSLHPKRRARLEEAVAEDPQAWTKAKTRAASWGLVRALGLLELAYGTEMTPRFRQRARALLELAASTKGAGEKLDLVRRPLLDKIPRRNRVVTISGLDGAGKSLQARALRDTLELLVVPAVVEWTPLGQNRTINVLRRAKKPLQPLRGDAASAGPETGFPFDDTAPADPAQRLRQRSGLVAHAWVLLVALANVAFHRRWTLRHPWSGRVVVYDRFVCDSAVQLEFWYGRNRRLGFEKWLLRALSPRPFRSFLLEVPPEVALIRKNEYALDELRRQHALYRTESKKGGVTVLDGEFPAAEISAQIARAVWTALRPHNAAARPSPGSESG